MSEEIARRIASLNEAKNNYAAKKVKGEGNPRDETALVAELLYLVSALRSFATALGCGERGDASELAPADYTLLSTLNRNVKSLQEQVLLIVRAPPAELVRLAREGRANAALRASTPLSSVAEEKEA